MSQNSEHILIDHLDNLLIGDTKAETENLIRSDKTIAREWQYLLYAVDGIREAGLYERVSAAKKLYQKSFVSKPAGGVVRSIYRNAFRVAACFLILLGATVIYKYTSVSSGKVYDEYYSSYELNTSRSGEVVDSIEQAFREKNWQRVIDLSATLRPRSSKYNFLAGIASMELKKYDNAINSFKEVIEANAKSGENYFLDEAEYYLAMSYLANNEPENALPLIEKIKNDSNHLYHAKLNELSTIDLRILDYKSSN